MRLNKLPSMASTNQARKKRIEWPDWIYKSLETLKPPENLTVSGWADKNRILDNISSAEPGQWKTSRVPYLKEIMDSFNNPDIEEIILVKPTQVGGTEALLNMLGYIVEQDPSPTLIVYPTEDLAKFTSTNRIQPMFHDSDKFLENESKILELQFDGMYIALSGANSPSGLASKPVRFVLFDEVDKFPVNAGKEADPRELAKERQNTFSANKKSYQGSTPTFSYGPIWKAWKSADDQRKYFVPCPHCGGFQVFEFNQIKHSEKSKTNDECKSSAYYECVKCAGIINDSHKMQMLRSGRWESISKTGTTKTAYHLNAIYSPWLRFGDILYKYLSTKDDPVLFQNFVNSWLAQPWEQTEVKMNSDLVLEKESRFEEGVIPPDAIILTGGVDVQKDHFYWTIRAWGPNVTSWNVSHGVADSYFEVEEIMNQSFLDTNGNQYIVNLCLIDSGYNTDEVYEFCAMNSDWLAPAKGSSTPLVKRYNKSQIDKPENDAHGMDLYIVDGAQYKEMIMARLKKPVGSGCWMVYKGCDREYANQISSEEKIVIKRGGREISEWKKKEKSENHWLDAEVYCSVAADVLKIRYMSESEEEKLSEHREVIKENNYLRQQDEGWIKNNNNWLRG
jgi:phage terminase large subunit GpA-like protein